METLPALLALLAVFVVALPLATWLLLGEDAAPRFERFDATRHGNPPEVAAFLRDNIAGLQAEQFHEVADLVRVRGGSLKMVMRVAVLQHPHGETATIAVAYSAQSGTVLPMVEFTAELSGGRVFDVNNSVAVPILAARSGHDVYRLPEVRDPIRLYHIFEILLRRRFGSSTLRQREIAADPARFLADVIDAEYHGQMEAGYYRFDEGSRRWRPTLRGACLMTWKMLPPFKQLIKAAVRRRARRILREIGMEGRDARPVAAITTVTASADGPTSESPPRDSPLEVAIAIGGFALLFVGMFFVQRWTHSRALSIAVFLGVGPIGLWIWMRRTMLARARAAGGDPVALARARSAANRGVLPIVGMGFLVIGLAGYREYTGRLPGLTVPSDFNGAIQALEHVTGRQVTKLEGHDSIYVVTVQTRWANRFLSAAVPKFAAQHFFLSRFDRNFRRDTSAVRLVLAPVLDPFAVLRLIGTHGEVDGQTTEDIAAGLRTMNAEHPFEFRNIGLDWVRGAFQEKVADPNSVARRLNALCPRVLAEDFHRDMELLERTIGRTGVFICRWQ